MDKNVNGFGNSKIMLKSMQWINAKKRNYIFHSILLVML